MPAPSVTLCRGPASIIVRHGSASQVEAGTAAHHHKKNGLRFDFWRWAATERGGASTIKKGLYEVSFAALSILQPQDKCRPTSFDGLQVDSTAETRRALAFANEFLDTAHRCGIPLLDMIDDEARMAIGCSLNGYLTASVLPRLEAPAPADVAYMCKRLSEIIDKWAKRELHHVPDVDLMTATLLVANEPDSKAAKMLKAGAVQRLLIRTLEHRLGWLCGRPELPTSRTASRLKRATSSCPTSLSPRVTPGVERHGSAIR